MRGCSHSEIHSVFPLAATFNNFIASSQKVVPMWKIVKGTWEKNLQTCFICTYKCTSLKTPNFALLWKIKNCLNFFVISWVFFLNPCGNISQYIKKSAFKFDEPWLAVQYYHQGGTVAVSVLAVIHSLVEAAPKESYCSFPRALEMAQE